MGTPTSSTAISPKPSQILMLLTYIVGGVGSFVAIFVIVTPDARQRKIGPIIGISVWALMMIVMGSFGLVFAIGT